MKKILPGMIFAAAISGMIRGEPAETAAKASDLDVTVRAEPEDFKIYEAGVPLNVTVTNVTEGDVSTMFYAANQGLIVYELDDTGGKKRVYPEQGVFHARDGHVLAAHQSTVFHLIIPGGVLDGAGKKFVISITEIVPGEKTAWKQIQCFSGAFVAPAARVASRAK